MPLYEYKCPGCGYEFEAFNHVAVRQYAQCTRCGRLAEKKMSVVNATFGFRLRDESHENGNRDTVERDV